MWRSGPTVVLSCVVGVAVCVVILLSGPEPLEASAPQGKPSVSIGPLERDVTANFISAFGSLTPRQTLQLTTQVPGEIVWVSDRLTAGGFVDQGERLFRVDEREYAIAVASAEAGYEQAQAKLELEQGHAENARREWVQWQNTSSDAVKPRPLALREPQLAEAAALVKAARAQLDGARLAFERVAVEAPWPASVVRAQAVVGQVLPVGQVIATLFPLDYGVAELQVPADTVRLLDAGIQQVELWPVHDQGAQPVIGVFEAVVRNLTNDTRLATVRVRIDTPLENEGWAYGMHLEARILTQQQRAVVQIPAEIVVGGNLIWVYRNGQARRHQVHPVRNSGKTVSVEDNFHVDDALILEYPIGLFDRADVDLGITTVGS